MAELLLFFCHCQFLIFNHKDEGLVDAAYKNESLKGPEFAYSTVLKSERKTLLDSVSSSGTLAHSFRGNWGDRLFPQYVLVHS